MLYRLAWLDNLTVCILFWHCHFSIFTQIPLASISIYKWHRLVYVCPLRSHHYHVHPPSGWGWSTEWPHRLPRAWWIKMLRISLPPERQAGSGLQTHSHQEGIHPHRQHSRMAVFCTLFSTIWTYSESFMWHFSISFLVVWVPNWFQSKVNVERL